MSPSLALGSLTTAISLGAAQSRILVPGALRLGTGVGVYTKCPPGGALAKGRTP